MSSLMRSASLARLGSFLPTSAFPSSGRVPPQAITVVVMLRKVGEALDCRPVQLFVIFEHVVVDSWQALLGEDSVPKWRKR